MILVRSGKQTRIFTKDLQRNFNQFYLFTRVLKPHPFRHPECGCRSVWSPDIHVPMLSARFVGFGFSEAIGWRRYAEGSGVR